MIVNLKCSVHPEEDIEIIDISKNTTTNSRTYCSLCIEKQDNFEQCLAKKNVPEQAQNYINQHVQKTKLKYESCLNKISKIIEQVTILKKQIKTIFKDQIAKIKVFQNEIMNDMKKEQQIYQGLTQDISRTKLEELARLLSGNASVIESKYFSSMPMETYYLNFQEFVKILHQHIDKQRESINFLLWTIYEKRQQSSNLQLKSYCNCLANNQTQSLIAGGIDKNIVVWEQKELKLIESAILTGHKDMITTLIIYPSGDMIVSGGAKDDKSLKLWKKTENKWNCIQTLLDHTEGITDLKLSPKEDQVISTSIDKSIKVWTLNQEQSKLQCIQTLKEHTNEVGYVSISSNQKLMATSSQEKYLMIFQQQITVSQTWKKHSKVETEGPIKRIHFIDPSTLICQQTTPPKLIIFEYNQQNEFKLKQQIALNELDTRGILFPFFSTQNSIYCKHEKFVYEVKKSESGKYYIRSIITGKICSGCVDVTNKSLILGNLENKKIEFYNIV